MLQANLAEAQRALTLLDDLVVARVLSPLQRAVLVVESAPAAPETLALVDAVAELHGEQSCVASRITLMHTQARV